MGTLAGQALGCSPRPETPKGPWIGGPFFLYPGSNPLITTDQEGVLVSNLVIYDDDGYIKNQTMIVIDATDGSVRQMTSDDDYVLTPSANITENVTAGYSLNVVVAEDKLTATVEITPTDGGDVLEFTLQAPDGETELQNEYYYKLVVSTPLNTAYIMYADYYPEDVTHYAVLDLSNPNSISRLEAFSFYLARWSEYRPLYQYEDLQIMSMWNGDSCYGRQHLYYNESHIVSANGMGYYTHTRAIKTGETIRDNSIYSLQPHTQVVERDDSSFGYLIATNYTLRERNVITGDLLLEIILSMEDIQVIVDELLCATDSPSSAPTALTPKTPPPTDPPVKTPNPRPSPTTPASSSGDPHFKTFSGDKFDYHGECDLVLVNNPSFENGLGLRLHVRTTRIKYFSFIETVALQIGPDVLEFNNDVENFLINGQKVEANHKHHKTMLGNFFVRRDKKAISVNLHRNDTSTHKRGFAKIDFHTRKNGFPAVVVDAGSNSAVFQGSLGLLGDWPNGRKLAQDGKTEFLGIDGPLADASAFAVEWQVRDDEPMLFSEARAPQYPATCLAPAQQRGSRLGMLSFKKEAEEACSHWKQDLEDCLFDVMATRDVSVAQEGHIVHIE